MSDLTDREQRAVRTTLLFLRVRSGGVWEPVARALNTKPNTISKIVAGSREVNASLAIRVARLIGVGVDELLAGAHMSSRVCRHCGHPPEDFADDEATVVEDRPPPGTLRLLK